MDVQEIVEAIQEEGFDTAIAVATNSEVAAGAACGQMTLME